MVVQVAPLSRERQIFASGHLHLDAQMFTYQSKIKEGDSKKSVPLVQTCCHEGTRLLKINREASEPIPTLLRSQNGRNIRPSRSGKVVLEYTTGRTIEGSST